MRLRRGNQHADRHRRPLQLLEIVKGWKDRNRHEPRKEQNGDGKKRGGKMEEEVKSVGRCR